MTEKEINSTTENQVQQLVKINEKLTDLHWIAAQIATEQDLNTLYNLINNGFQEITGITKCGFYLVDQQYNFTELTTSMKACDDPYWQCTGTTAAIQEALQNKQEVIPVQAIHCGHCKQKPVCPQVTLLVYALYDRSGKAKEVLVAYDLNNPILKYDYLKILELYILQASLALENAKLTVKLRKLAVTDGLTGLYNQRHFMEYLTKQIVRCKQQDDFFSLLMMDVDNFKSYNDNFGHLAGDYVLQKLGRIITETIAKQGKVFRYGGEEFAIILPGYSFIEGFKIAEQIRQSVATTYFNNRKITISIGLAQFPLHAANASELIEYADKGLYNAKTGGKNKVCLFI